MAQRKRRLLIVVAVLILLLVGAALALPFLIDADSYRESVRAAAEEAMGRPVSLGRIQLRLLPRLALSAESLAVGATPEEGGGELLRAARLQIGAELWPLLQGRLEVTRLVVVNPELRLRRGGDGSWILPLPVSKPTTGGGEDAGGTAGELTVGLVALRQGRVLVAEAGGERAVLEDLDLELRDVALDRPLNFTAGGIWLRPGQESRRIELDGTIGWEAAGEALAVSLEPTVLKTGKSRLDLQGRLDAGARETGLDFRISGADLAPVDLADILSIAGISLPGPIPQDAVRGTAGLTWRQGRAVLDPLELQLLGGRLEGDAVLRPTADPPQFQLSAGLADIRADELLRTALDMNILSGRLQGEVELRGSGLTYEQVVRSARGGGRLEIVEGHLDGLDVLSAVSQASGVFGEDSIQKLSRQLESAGMDFALLAGEFVLENGRLVSPDLLLKTEDLKLLGGGSLDLLSGQLDGTFRLILSRALSDSMKGEGSRAARLFWNDEMERVSLPLTLKGPAAAPEASIDWAAAATSYLESEIRRNPDADLGGALRRLLGKDKAPAPPAPPAAPAAPAAPQDAPAEDADPGAGITSARWGGPILAPDLQLQGWVAATRLASAGVRVEDARGRAVDRVDSLPQVQSWRQSAADSGALARVQWTWEADGKRFLAADFPVQVIVTVTTEDGRQAEIRRTVQR